MAKCRLCKKDISDGIEYCEDCLEKKTVLNDESYLDSLLNSVKNNAEPIRNNYKKTQGPRNPEPVKAVKNVKEIHAEEIDPADLADFDQLALSEDLEDPIIISDEELFGSAEDYPHNQADISVEDLIGTNLHMDKTEDTQDDHGRATDTSDHDDFSMESGASMQDPQDDFDIEAGASMQDPQDDFGMESGASMQDPQDDFDMEANALMQRLQDEFGMTEDASMQEFQDNIDPELISKFSNSAMEDPAEDSYDPALGELLSGFGLSEEVSASEEEGQAPTDIDMQYANSDKSTREVRKPTEEEDFLSLLGQFGMDDPVAADVQAISELLKNPENKRRSESIPSDVGEVFSDALTAVSGLEDLEYFDPSLPLPMEEPSNQKDKSKKAKSKDKDKTKKKKDKSTKGKGIFGVLFGNVVDEKQVNEAKKNKASAESEATLDNKKVKGKKAKKKASSDKIEEIKDSPKKAEPGFEEAEKSKGKKDKVKKPKKEKKKAAIELIDDYDEIEGRINRLGATVVFTFFGLMVALLLIGTSLFTYSVSIKNATNYFDRQKYTEAYNEVYGMELRDEDIELYEKIMTVMFVNKQLNSYNNYYAMKKYPEALDSLLKGLKRYDKYIELATMLGIKSDLDYVRDQIMAELEYAYMLSEEDAEEILSLDSQRKYSIAVYNAVLENMKY